MKKRRIVSAGLLIFTLGLAQAQATAIEKTAEGDERQLYFPTDDN